MRSQHQPKRQATCEFISNYLCIVHRTCWIERGREEPHWKLVSATRTCRPDTLRQKQTTVWLGLFHNILINFTFCFYYHLQMLHGRLVVRGVMSVCVYLSVRCTHTNTNCDSVYSESWATG